jgi:UDP-N-acetyl-2-amino-2-deoxyglucuronate dehydrogenase
MAGPRVIVIGAAANIFRSHLAGLQGIGAEIVGLHDTNAERLAAVAETVGAPAFADVNVLVQQKADVAVILAPHPFHADLAITCMRAGLHVLTEKPIAVEVAEADRMVQAAEHEGRTLAVAFQHRTRGEVQQARRLIQDGVIGEIQRVDLLATWPRRHSYFKTAPWRGSWRGEGGGILINQGQHDLDLLCYLAGQPSRVIGWRRTQLHQIETEDTISAIAAWPSGATGFIHISTAEVDEAQRIGITGTAGRLCVTKGQLELIRNEQDFRAYAASEGNPYASPPTLPVERFTGEGGSHLDIYEDLVEALAGAHPPIAPARSATLTLELANAITQSSVIGGEVSLPLDREAYHQTLEALRTGTASR